MSDLEPWITYRNGKVAHLVGYINADAVTICGVPIRREAKPAPEGTKVCERCTAWAEAVGK